MDIRRLDNEPSRSLCFALEYGCGWLEAVFAVPAAISFVPSLDKVPV